MLKKIVNLMIVILLLITPYSFGYLNTNSSNNTILKDYDFNNLYSDYYKNSETNYELVIEDDANLLTVSEEKKLYDDMIELTKYGNIIFKSINRNNYSSTAKYAKNYYNEQYGKESGTIFLIDMAKREIYIFSNGANYTVITNSKAETITDNIYKLATNKKYYECARQAFEQIKTVLEGGKIAEPMKYISNILLALMISLLFNFAIFKKATKNKVASENEQIKECDRFFEYTTPNVKKVGTRREYSPVSHGSSGGGRRRSAVVGGGGRRPEVIASNN